MRSSLAALAALMLATPASAPAHPGGHPPACEKCRPLLEAAVADPARKADAARDVYRHPVETLAFFDIEPTMKVGEFAPGGGWYSRILGHYLAADGKLVGLFFDPRADAFGPAMKQGIRDGAVKFPQEVAGWTGLPADRFAAYTLDAVPAGEAGTFDRILILRMLHNEQRWGMVDSDLQALRALLKPGGMIGVEQHRARADAPDAYADGSKGYLREKDVIAMMAKNGFTLVAASEINANPKDTADWPEGVWTLPPSYALKDVDKAKYAAIGESDRMTLLFRKDR